MSQHWIYINSPAYRRFVEASKQHKWMLWGTTIVLGGVAAVASSLVMNATNPNMAEEGYKSKEEELAKLPLHAQLVARKNRENLKAMILDITGGTDKARYRDLLQGRIHNTPHGTTMPDEK